MSTSKQKEKLRHYKSLDNLCTQGKDTSTQKRFNKNQHNDSSKNNKNVKKFTSSRFPTETYDRIISKEQSAKFSQLFKSQAKGKKQDKKQKNHQIIKNNSTTHIKRTDKNKMQSPVVNKFVIKKEITQYQPMNKNTKKDKRPLKKDKIKIQPNFQKSPFKIQHIQSIFLDKHTKKSKNSHEKSRQCNSHKKSKKQLNKMPTQFNLEASSPCLLSQDIQIIDLVGQGTFGKVFRGRLRKTGDIIAIKRVVQDSRYKNRQIQIIKILKNDFIVQVLGSFITYQSRLEYLNIVMRYYEENLYTRITFYKETRINNLEVKVILYQLFKGLSYLHSLDVCHRDIKPENILLNGCSAAICDFGSAKILKPGESNISYICARCYRAPQLIFGATKYGTVIDIWSAGCVILEMLNGSPLFIGETSISHLLEIMKIMGTPSEEEVRFMNPEYSIEGCRLPSIGKTEWKVIFPEAEESLLSLIDCVMVYNPLKRAKAIEVLAHSYFDEIRDRFAYQHVRCQYHLRNFFSFSERELRGFSHLEQLLIPQWYRDQL